MTEQRVSFDAIVAALKERGFEAFVEQSGGNIATIYVGTKTVPSASYEGELEYQVLIGPGAFDGPGWTNAYGYAGDLFVGRGDREEYEFVVNTDEPSETAKWVEVVLKQLDSDSPIVDHVEDDLSFSIHVRQQDDTFTAYIYFGSEVVFTFAEPCSRTPAGIEDFASVAKKRFAQRLARVLDKDDE